ncbi:YlbF family regulator [Peribacillus sp. JNUCC 23]|uniref:YlbF family regulator n=1 Tax=Peribacillus sp. NPDC096379 TaxID=3364393 RepID=UPI000780AA4D
MLATMERVSILQKAEALAEMVIESKIGQEYFELLYNLRHDQGAQDKIRKFTSLKDLFEEVQRFGKYHPDYKRVNLEIRQVKREMDIHPSIAAFKRAETELQAVLDEISHRIGHAVSPFIKVPAGSPFFESGSSCGGSCGTGGSCGCSA